MSDGLQGQYPVTATVAAAPAASLWLDTAARAGRATAAEGILLTNRQRWMLTELRIAGPLLQYSRQLVSRPRDSTEASKEEERTAAAAAPSAVVVLLILPLLFCPAE